MLVHTRRHTHCCPCLFTPIDTHTLLPMLVHTHRHTHTLLPMLVHTCRHTHTLLPMLVHTRRHTHTHTTAHAFHTRRHTHTLPLLVHIHRHTHTLLPMLVHIHRHTHTHRHTYYCPCLFTPVDATRSEAYQTFRAGFLPLRSGFKEQGSSVQDRITILCETSFEVLISPKLPKFPSLRSELLPSMKFSKLS